MRNKLILKKDKDFLSAFDPETGFYIRSGILKEGKDTGIDPFQAMYPELLDIGIMGHCKHGKSGLCLQSGVECYQDGLNKSKPNMKLEDFERIIQESKGKLFQVALGGRGDPDEHENFEEILKICKENNIVPNFTTSGFGMTSEKAKLCKEYCGAVAVSWYRNHYTLRAIKMLLKAGVKTNIHFVLNKNTFNEAIQRLKGNDFPKGINAVVFLLHKPVGLGQEENKVSLSSNGLQDFFNLVIKEHPFKIGFDSCTFPALIRNENFKNLDCMDTCEGARFSAYITSDMIMTPCSFDQDNNFGISLRNSSILEAWESEPFEEFRRNLQNNCPNCKLRKDCMGGCPIMPQIVLCPDRKTNNSKLVI